VPWNTVLNPSVMDTYAFDRFWARVAPLNLYGNDTLLSAHHDTFFSACQPRYLSTVPRDNIYRQFASLWFITVSLRLWGLTQWMFGVILYFVFASLSYHFVFDKTYLTHPKFLASQIRKEIALTMYSLPQMALFTAPWFTAEVRGYSKLYLDPNAYGWWYIAFQFPLFLVFTDCLIYWIHRGLHHPLIYKTLHKPHHRWIVPTPFASHAFHPLDGYAQVPLLEVN
jgi:Delta7-sterol 5-desaturase